MKLILRTRIQNIAFFFIGVFGILLSKECEAEHYEPDGEDPEDKDSKHCFFSLLVFLGFFCRRSAKPKTVNLMVKILKTRIQNITCFFFWGGFFCGRLAKPNTMKLMVKILKTRIQNIAFYFLMCSCKKNLCNSQDLLWPNGLSEQEE